MADQLNMNKLTLSDSQHAQQGPPNGNHGGGGGGGFQRSAYIPPHARSSGRGPAPGPAAAALDGAPPANGDIQNSAWAAPQAK